MSIIAVKATWTCKACHATAETEQLVSVIEQALRKGGALLTPPPQWQQTTMHVFCPVHGNPLPAAAERLAIPDEVAEVRLRNVA